MFNNFKKTCVFLLIGLTFLSNLKAISSTSMTKSKSDKSKMTFISEDSGIKEYNLPNGIKILLKENHAIPLVTFSIWYKVGSRNETKGIYGIAHFLEHMMFKGTKKYKKGEISQIIQNHGGVFNAFTSPDGTAYYETISPQYLEKVVEIEADRLKGSLIEEKELDLERNVVLSELEGGLNNPATLLDQKLRQLAYESGPYKHPTIGYEDEIKKINSTVMRDFYKKFYNPNNATIVLVGDFNEKNTLSLIEKYFKNIKNDNEPNLLVEETKIQTKEKTFKIKKAGSFKIVEIAYHIPEISNDDIYPLNVLEEILLKSEKSSLHKKLIEAGLATELYGGSEASKNPSLFYILCSLTPKASPKQVENIITKEIDRLLKYPPLEADIIAAKNRIKASYLFNLDGTYNQVVNIGFFEIINNWKQSTNWVTKINEVEQDDIVKVIKKYFNRKNRTIGYFIPKIRKGEKYESQPLNVSSSHSYTGAKNKLPEAKIKEKNNIKVTQNHKKPDERFKYKKFKLKDGSTLVIYRNIDLPITYLTGFVKGGASTLENTKKPYCEAISRLMEKGSTHYKKDAVIDTLETTGSEIDFSCDDETFKFNLLSLNENFNASAELLFDLLQNPTFTKDEVSKEKKKLIAETAESKDNTVEIANRRCAQIVYPQDHPYYEYSLDEEIKQIKRINREVLIGTHKALIKNNKTIITIVSNLPEDLIISKLNDVIDSSIPKITKELTIPDVAIKENPVVEKINIEEKPQSDVFLVHAGALKRTDPDFYKVNIANYILGGSALTSRLADNVRDNEGLVYTIYSYLSASFGRGEVGIYFGANNKNTDKAIKLINLELAKFVDKGITAEELRKAKASLIDSFVSRNLSSYKSIANTLATIELYELGENYISNYPTLINSLKLNEINKAIKKYYHPDKLNIVIAGETKTKEEAKSKKK